MGWPHCKDFLTCSIAFCSYVAISLPELFPRHPDHGELRSAANSAEMGQTGRGRFSLRR